MNITKETHICPGSNPTQEQLAEINALAKGALTQEQVYVFSLRLCDDRLDRDYERFDTEALPRLAELFVGKCGIVDHKWSAEHQIARIFRTEVVREADGSFIKAWAYIRRGGKGEEWIADIEAGIKKEVSVGCAMGESVCSICGSDYGTCGHRKGQLYEGQLCSVILRQPVDAYEFSFVAVPAQPAAGVLKRWGGAVSLKQLAWEHGAQEEYEKLCKLAELGESYTRQLTDDVVRLCLMLDLGAEEQVLRTMVQSVSPDALSRFKAALEERVARSYPIRTQLPALTGGDKLENDYFI